MEFMQTGAQTAAITSTTFPLLVEQIVEELMQAETYPQVCYLMGRLLGAKHMTDIQLMSQEQIQQVRDSLKPLMEQSYFWNWAISKPYGYPGDYMVLEFCYENKESANSTTPLGKLLDRWLLESQLASGVRERKDMLSAFIERKVNAHHKVTGRPMNLLSLASGSARELRDLSDDVLGKLNGLLIDQDVRSLDYAAQNLPDTIKIQKGNALRLRPSDFTDTFDLVYSFGFFDYLKDDVIVHCLNLCRSVVAPGGSVIFPLKMNSKYRHWFYDLILDWRFVKREREDGLALASEAGLDVVELLETANESVVFYHCVPRQI